MAAQNQPQKPSDQKFQSPGNKMPNDNKQNFNSDKTDRVTGNPQRDTSTANRSGSGSKIESDMDQEDETSI